MIIMECACKVRDVYWSVHFNMMSWHEMAKWNKKKGAGLVEVSRLLRCGAGRVEGWVEWERRTVGSDKS